MGTVVVACANESDVDGRAGFRRSICAPRPGPTPTDPPPVWSRWLSEPHGAPADGRVSGASRCSWPATTRGCTPRPPAACRVCRSYRG